MASSDSNTFQVSLPAWAANVAVVRRVQEKEGLGGDEATTAQTTDPANKPGHKLLSHRYSSICDSHIYPNHLPTNEPLVLPAAFTAMAMLNILKPAAQLQIGQLFLELVNESKTTANRASVFHQVQYPSSLHATTGVVSFGAVSCYSELAQNRSKHKMLKD